MKTFETDVYLMTIHEDGLIEFKVKKNRTFTENDVWQSRDQSTSYMPGKKFVVLMEAEENFNATVGARRAGASEEYTHHVKALALFSDRTTETIMGNLFLKVSRPKVATRFFDDRDKALEWLRSQQY
jgi:hypothetical protein